MARSWQYPRWRRILMQVTLWVLLGATIALAEWVTRSRSGATWDRLVQTQTIDRITIKLPAKWATTTVDGTTVLIAREPRGGHTLTVMRQRVRGVASPQEFLSHSGLLRGVLAVSEDEDSEDSFPMTELSQAALMQPISIAGWPGVMTVVRRPQISPMGLRPSLSRELIACTILPSRTALVLRLEGPDEEDAMASDTALMKRIAEAVGVADESPAQHQDWLTLSSGVTLKLPAEYVVMPQPDPNRTDRQIFREQEDGGRLVIDLIPCVHFPGELTDDVSSMLVARNPTLANATIRADEEGIWRVDWPGQNQPHSTTGARLITQADGNSVLAVFAGAPVDSNEFKRAFSILSGEVTEKPVKDGAMPDYSEMIKSGQAEAARLAGLGLPGLIEQRADEWWTLRDFGTKVNVGWVHARFDDSVAWGGLRETRWQFDKHVTLVTENWEGDPTLTDYKYTMVRSESDQSAAADSDGRFAQSARQGSLLHQGRLGTRVQYRDKAVESRGGPGPANFLPGGWLPAIIGKLSSTPMVVQAESIPTPECIPVGTPLKLVITPGQATKLAEDGHTPLRCVNVEVSGTGEVARYYVRSDGSVESVDFPDDLRETRSDETTIKFEFNSDPRMTP